MAKDFARSFYSSKTWQDCRNEYMRRRHYLCENCLRKGIYKPAEIVHHKIELDPINIENPEIALCFDNLEAVCRECHDEYHDNHGRCAIEAKILGCKLKAYDSRFPKVSRWKILDNKDAVSMLQEELDRIDG